MKALDTGSDDDEDVPLSTLKIRAQSEVGLRSPLLTQAHGNRLSSIPYGGSAIGVSGTSTTGGQHQSRHDKHASTTSLHVPSSAGMPRSLSTFSTHVCEAGTSRQLQARSASSHAIPTMGSTGGLPRHVSLSSLIEFEQGRLQAALPSVQKSLGPASSRPSNSSDGSSSYPPTPTDGATRVGSLSIPPKTKHFSPTREVQQARNDSSKSGAFSDRSKARQRQEARNSGMVLGGSLPTSLASTSTAPLSFGWPTSSPQALQGMPAPAGIDAALYNSRQFCLITQDVYIYLLLT